LNRGEIELNRRQVCLAPLIQQVILTIESKDCFVHS